MLAQATLGFFLLLWRESRERAWPQSNCSLCTPTHSSGLASTIRNVERVARDTAREGRDGGAAHPRARDTAANRRNDVVRECLSRQDASLQALTEIKDEVLQTHTHTHARYYTEHVPVGACGATRCVSHRGLIEASYVEVNASQGECCVWERE